MSTVVLDGLTVKGPDGTIGDKDAADVLFTQLEHTWQWSPEVTKYLREELECETAHDLLTAFRTPGDWSDCYKADIKLAADPAKQVKRGKRARVAQCHEKLMSTQKEAADIKAKGEEAVDFDIPLKSDVIRKMNEAFWNRHKITSPLKKIPGDLLISRLYKELDKRCLHVTDLPKIKGVVWERKAESRKEKVADQLYLERTPDAQEESRPQTVRAYLECMEMCMLALAIVGAKPFDPAPKEAETRETDPSDYVNFPYQHSVDYLHQANTFVTDAQQVHSAAQVYQMLKRRDIEERSEMGGEDPHREYPVSALRGL